MIAAEMPRGGFDSCIYERISYFCFPDCTLRGTVTPLSACGGTGQVQEYAAHWTQGGGVLHAWAAAATAAVVATSTPAVAAL